MCADRPPGGLVDGSTTGNGRWLRSVRVATVTALMAAVALTVGGSGSPHAAPSGSSSAGVPARALHLPTAVNAPGAWSDDEGPDGPLAALGVAMRSQPQGLTGQRQRLSLFGVSAVDGRSTWIDLPGVGLEDRALLGWFALSPNGRWIGWSRLGQPQRNDPTPLLGWAVMDTRTRQVRDLAPPAQQLREAGADVVFSGDSRYLTTSYDTRSAPPTRGHRFVAWDVRDGTRTVLEAPGHYWLPDPGSSSTGVVWSRLHTVFRANVSTGARSSYALPRSVVAASWAPDDTAFAYIGKPSGSRASWRLYAGRTLAQAREHSLPLAASPGQLLGWRDSRHVVVGHFRRTVEVVDVVTGHVVEHDLAGSGEPLNPPLLAADLWRNPLVAAVRPSGTTDPRRPWWWGGGAALVLLSAGVVLRPASRMRKVRRDAGRP